MRRLELPEKQYSFKRGGFDLYIDGARFLPYNTTITKVVGRIFSHHFDKEGHDIATGLDLNSDIFNPEYNFRLEFRDVQFTPQATLLVKIYTIDSHTKELVVLGYSILNIFVERGTNVQPVADGSHCSLNDGGHQLPLYRTAPNPKELLSLEASNPPPPMFVSLLGILGLFASVCGAAG